MKHWAGAHVPRAHGTPDAAAQNPSTAIVTEEAETEACGQLAWGKQLAKDNQL